MRNITSVGFDVLLNNRDLKALRRRDPPIIAPMSVAGSVNITNPNATPPRKKAT